MDNVTHTLVGVALANAGIAKRFGRGTTLTLALASNLPDVDGLCLFADDGILLRRTLTHSVFGIVALSAAASWLLHLRYKEMSWKTLFGLCVLGASLHTFFDLLNSFGVLLLHPVCDHRFELGWVFIIDLILTGLLIAPLLLTRWIDLQLLSRASLVCVALYIALCGISRTAAFHHLDHAEPTANFTYVFPEPLGPHRFRGVAKENGAYKIYLIHSFSGGVELKSSVPTHENYPKVQAARETERARKIEAFFKAPVWTENEDSVEVYDLRFRSVIFPRDSVFTYRFKP